MTRIVFGVAGMTAFTELMFDRFSCAFHIGFIGWFCLDFIPVFPVSFTLIYPASGQILSR